MKLAFVNHASVIYDYDHIRLISDPWIEGKVFDNGWSLLAPTRFTYEDFKTITHIWFSHEHPDHFFPPNIKNIPAEIRKNITVLYQETKDKKVVEFCRKLGFKSVEELAPGKTYPLSEKFNIINAPFGHDSWLLVSTDQFKLLNTNDCVINTKEKASAVAAVTGDIDILLTQFSYASKHGNADQPEKREKAVNDKKVQMQLQINAFHPKIVIPMASFVWFSHEENFYMNDRINKIDETASFLKEQQVEPVVLYPGDEYLAGTAHDNSIAIARYLEDLKKIVPENTTKTISAGTDELKKNAATLIQQIRKEDKLSYFLLSFYPLKIYLPDLEKSVKFSVRSGLQEISVPKEQTNIIMTSEVLNYCLKFNWGFGTTHVNGRFQTVRDEDMKLFNYYVSVTDSLNHHDSTMKRVFHKILRKTGIKQ